MESFGSEIGQKMRSAVKAKLLELGTGGSAGYIDDELPDYVMIMVANKRSKQQMISDLNLFLGTQTELFVTWLHEVLHKLQEVTLPAVGATSKKRKTSQKDEVANKKDKKSNKNRKTGRKSSEDTVATTTTTESEKPTTTTNIGSKPVINSITDVFADALLEKAKQNLDVAADAVSNIKKSKGGKVGEEKQPEAEGSKETNEFNIPTISEISSSTTVGGAVASENREKDLAELAEIQKKIYAAKKHLKHLVDNNEDIDDEDFINLKDDGDGSMDELNECDDLQKKDSTKVKSPIVFEAREKNPERTTSSEIPESSNLSLSRPRLTPPPISSAAIQAKTIEQRSGSSLQEQRPEQRGREKREAQVETSKRPVHERLGMRTQSRETTLRERRVRQEKELYVPTFRRNQVESERGREKQREHNVEKDRGREREREREKDRAGKTRKRESRYCRSPVDITSNQRSSSSAEANKNREASTDRDRSSGQQAQRQRIGSRVIVAPPKPVDPSEEEDEKPVNSVIKIKPRPPVSPSKQACKNLLLRAVAEAQRSTILAESKAKEASAPRAVTRVSASASARKSKLYTKSYRDRLKHVTSATAILRRTTQNLVIKVEGGLTSHKHQHSFVQEETVSHGEEEEEYVPESMPECCESDTDPVYVPQTILKESTRTEDVSFAEGDAEDSVVDNSGKTGKTQFVVTLNDEKTPFKYAARSTKKRSLSKSPSRSPMPEVSSSSLSRQNGTELPSTTHISRSREREASKHYSKPRSSLKASSSISPSTAMHKSDRDSSNSPPYTPPPKRRTEFIEIYRKSKEIKKIIIKNDSEEEDNSPKKTFPEKPKRAKRHNSSEAAVKETRSNTPPMPPRPKYSTSAEKKASAQASLKRKRTPIKFDFDKSGTELNVNRTEKSGPSEAKRRSKSSDREKDLARETRVVDERRKISFKNTEAKKYDNIPALSSVAIESTAMKVIKPKERCKYHPNCTKQFCDFYHPTAPCKTFPNCKFADKCMYSHPKCKYDVTCTNIDCNFSHSGPRNSNLLQPTAPPLSSHVVPVQNYKSISAAPAASSAMCKYYPNCTKIGCTFYHPKACRFGKNCINKLECSFYHHEIQSSSKFKWVASVV